MHPLFNIMVTVIVTSVLLRKDASMLMKKGKNVKTVRKLIMHATIIVFTLKVLQMINCFLIFEYIVAIFRFLTYNYIESGIEAS